MKPFNPYLQAPLSGSIADYLYHTERNNVDINDFVMGQGVSTFFIANLVTK